MVYCIQTVGCERMDSRYVVWSIVNNCVAMNMFRSLNGIQELSWTTGIQG